MGQKLRFGVIGAGSFTSRRHIPTIIDSPYAELVALCRRNEEMLRKIADHFNCPNTFTDYRRMLDEVEMDAVLVTTPHALHYEHARAALEKGLHVMIEKPMSLKADEARELAGIAKDKGLVIVVALNPPFWSHTAYLRQAIRSGVLGEIEGVDINWVGNAEHVFGLTPMPDSMPGVVPPTLFRADPKLGGGGHFVDSGSHLVSELLWTTGLKAREVCALMDDSEFDMRTNVNLTMENGAVCTISNIGNSGISRRIHSTYFGSKATLFIDGMPFKVTLCKPDEDPVIVPEEEMPEELQPVDDLINAILGKSDPLCSADDGLQVVEVIEAAYISARTGRKVAL
ncbi:Gfo/Idh/MocA family protein [Candidatus Poribacteria bacterium]